MSLRALSLLGVSLLFTFSFVAEASAQRCPEGDCDPPRSAADWRVRGRIEFAFPAGLSRRELGRRPVRVTHRGRRVRGHFAYDRRTGRARFTPRRPLDTRFPFAWEVRGDFPVPDPPLWVALPYICPFPWTVDDDADGIPDCGERFGSYYNGVPLYAYGAREDQTDIFIEVDYMVDADRPWITPTWEALERVRLAFLNRGYRVHFDAGDLFGGAYLEAALFNLGGGGEIPLLEPVPWASPSVDCDEDNIEWTYFPEDNFLETIRDVRFLPNRARSFYYLPFLTYTYEVGPASKSGLAMRRGANAIVTFGSGWGPIFETAADGVTDEMRAYQIINYQAGTLMHEFGHLLGLKHGGDDGLTHKPNYLSVMNAPYQIFGLPTLGGESEGDRFYVDKDTYCPIQGLSKVDLESGPFGPWWLFRVDYFDGLNADLLESDLDETAGLGGQISGGVDWNCDGDADDVGISADINDKPGAYLLQDHDDWSAIELYHRTWFVDGGWPNDGLPFACPRP